MEKPFLRLEIKTAEQLDKALSAITENDARDANHLAVLNLFGPQVLIRQFDLPRLSNAEIKDAIKLEAAEIFSILPKEIEIDYQIMNQTKDKITGVFAAIPKKTLIDYISRLYKAKLTPVGIIPDIFSRINHFLSENKIADKNFCVIDFYKDSVTNIISVNNGKCEFLREIHDESQDDAEKEIAYSLKFIIGKSRKKQFAGVYILGDVSNKNNLISNLKRDLNIEITHYSSDPQRNSPQEDLFFNIDFIKSYGFSLPMREKIMYAANFVLFICLVAFFVLSIKLISQGRLIKNLSTSFKISDYNYAKGLQESLQLFKNAK